MAEDLRIKITGSLDEQKTQSQLQGQLNQIENKLNLQLGNINVNLNSGDFKKAEQSFKKITTEFNREINKAIKQLENADLDNKILKEISRHKARIPSEGSPYHRELMDAKKDSGFPMRVKKGTSIDAILPEISKAVGEAELVMEDIVSAVARGKKKYGYSDVANDPLIKQLEMQTAKAKANMEQMKHASSSSEIFGTQQKGLSDDIAKTNEMLEQQIKLVRKFVNSMNKLGNIQDGIGKTPTVPKLGNNLNGVHDQLMSGLNDAYAKSPLMIDEDFQRIFTRISEMSNKTSIDVAKDIEKEIGQYHKLENSIEDVVNTQQKLDSVTSDKTNGNNGNVNKYSDLQKRVEEIKNSAKDISKVNIQTAEDINDVRKATISYTDDLGRLVKEKYKLVETNNILDDGNESKRLNEWQLDSHDVTDNIEKRNKEEQRLVEQMAKFREQSMARRLADEQKLEKAQTNAINAYLEGNRKEIEAQENLQKEIQKTLTLFEKEKEIQKQNLKRRFQDNVDESALDNQLNKVRGVDPNSFSDMKEFRNWQREINLGFNEISASARTATSHTLTFGQQLSTAMERFPIWMLAATAFYAPLRAMQDMTSRLIEIDTLMTDIQRVMDAPEFQLTDLLNEAVIASEELSSKLTDTLAIIGEFARMGDYSNSELIDMSSTAQVLQNISDLDAKSSVDTLTSAMNNFNITAEESIQVADKLNEVDNNFAISTKDLSDGIRKAASTAKTFGVDINELTGYIAAIGSTTRESGNIIGNGLKTIMSRITTMGGAKTALEGINISIKDMGGNIRPVSDILEELSGKWTTLSDEQRQNLGVTLAGRYQLSR
jgi:TP901 family phage tail tape measure protein